MLPAAKKRRNSTWFFSSWSREPQLLMRYMRWLSHKLHCNKAPHNHRWISSYLYIRQCIFILTTSRGKSSNDEVTPPGYPQWSWELAYMPFIPVQNSLSSTVFWGVMLGASTGLCGHYKSKGEVKTRGTVWDPNSPAGSGSYFTCYHCELQEWNQLVLV